MKKLLKWFGIIVGALLIILILGIIALPFVFPLEKIKDFAAAKIAETIRREVKIEKVSFDIFSGIKLKGLYVGNRAGFAKKPFIAADAIELRYAFWPLFSRQIIIKEIRLVKPEILVEKNARGEFNFSDLLQSSPNPKATTQKPAAKPLFNLFITAFAIKDGKITYADQAARTTNEIRKLNVKVSGFELALIKPIDLKASAIVTYQGKEVPIALSGRIGVNLAREAITLSSLALSIAGESLNASATVSGWKRSPQIDFSVASGGINIDPLLALFAASAPTQQPKARPGELTKTINRAMASISRNLTVKGNVNLDNLSFQKFKADKIDLNLSLAGKRLQARIKEIKVYDGTLAGDLGADLNVPGLAYEVSNLRLTGFNAAPFSDAIVETFLTKMSDYKDLLKKVYGTLDISAALKGRGVEPQDIFANLSLDGSLTLKNGELKRLKTLAEIGKTIKSNTLQDNIKFGSLYTAFSLKDRVVTAKALKIAEPEFKVFFNGGADLKSLKWVAGNRLTLKLAPKLTQGLPKEFSLFKDPQGWFELTFELTGELKKPIPKPILEKPFEAAVGKLKVKIEAAKVEVEQKVKAEIATQEAAAKKALEKEKTRLQEEAKNKLKEMIKF
ncbi:MAG: AsmA family protein [Candidatus Margulisbacteria bacterium]|nr:AsmA family protein [Candidatus Margulisiibacteriota bacterium]